MRSVAIAFALAALAACEHRPPGAAAPAPLVDDEGMLQLDGLGKFGPQIREAMGTSAERAARAPYSPPGWPLRRGEDVGIGSSLSREYPERRWELEAAFPETCGIHAPFWVGDRVFGAFWMVTEYIGHFREYVDQARWFSESPEHRDCRLPPHLGGEVPAALAWMPYDEVARDPDSFEHRPHWTRERWLAGYAGENDRRSQREAFGLPLPSPLPDLQTMRRLQRECLEENKKGGPQFYCPPPDRYLPNRGS